MSKSGHPHVHQDYLARVRYSNALPPPPFYPKFLDIPNTGLSSGLYTSALYASRLAREQPLNIELDAELGMPIDLVGIEGVFEGNEEKIMSSDDSQPLHPRDKELLRPINALGKPVASSSAVSFLRRTEYISSSAAVNKAAAAKKALMASANANRNKKRPEANKDDPISILRGIIRGFDLAYPRDAYTGPDSDKNIRGADISPQEKMAWTKPKHPTKPNLTLLDSYPILPDPDSTPDTGNYVLLKYQTNPSDVSTHHDPRLNVALVRPLLPTAEEEAAYKEKVELARADPTRATPLPEYRYDVYIPENPDSVAGIKRKFDTQDPSKDSEALYDYEQPETGRRAFRYKRLRTYETYNQNGNPDEAWNDSVAMMLNDGIAGSRLKRGAYLYPIVQRTSLRAQRKNTLGAFARGTQVAEAQEEDPVDLVELRIRELKEEEVGKIAEYTGRYLPAPAAELASEE